MSQPYRLPPRGAAGAPTFDPEHPETLQDFFEDLEYMLEQADVLNDQKRKEHAVRYAPSTQKALWRAFESYAATKTYEDFKREVIREYLGEDGKRLYSLGDLKALLQIHAAKGFHSSSEFKVYEARIRAARQLEDSHARTMRDFNFRRGDLVLMRNTAIEKALNRKMRPRYLGPYIVLSRNRGGAYLICELDGAVLDRPIAAFRLLPYLARQHIDTSWLEAGDYLDISTARIRELEASHATGEENEDLEDGEREREVSSAEGDARPSVR